MRTGLTASLIAHAALITLGLVGLSGVKPLEPEEVESISIDLVPVEAFSNIRAGTEQSKVIETQTPSVVDTLKPAQLAEPTGNTEKDQPKPQASEKATPAPTVQTAPQPQVEPTPEPAPKPVEVAEAAPAPETPAPVLAAEPTPAAEPKETAPKPVIKTASIDQKRAEFKKKQDEEAKQRAAERAKKEAEKAKPADKVSDIINAENSRGATTGEGGQATAGKETGTAARLTQSERDALAAQMRECFSPPFGATTADAARLLVELNRDGTVSGTPQIVSAGATTVGNATALAAQRAVMRCAPYKLAADKYDEWRQVDVTFDPLDVLR